jgi:hypothetical protein
MIGTLLSAYVWWATGRVVHQTAGRDLSIVIAGLLVLAFVSQLVIKVFL